MHPAMSATTLVFFRKYNDLCEFDDTLTRNSKRYVVTFIDDCSDYTFIYLLKNKVMPMTRSKFLLLK